MDIEQIKEKFPFLTIIKSGSKEYIGIIQNSDEKIITFYDLGLIKLEDDKKVLLSYGDCWWWESNRLIPINIFLTGKLKPFRYCLKTITKKDCEIVLGPVTSLHNLLKKRIKRRQIQLIRKV